MGESSKGVGKPHDFPWLRHTEGVVIDLDGTLVRGCSVLPGAIQLFEKIADQTMIVTNNSSDVGPDLARMLQALGFPVAGSQLVLAGEETVRWVAANRPGQRVMMLASPRLKRFARELDLALTSTDPNVVLLARDPTFNYNRLAEAANHVRAGAELVVTNADRVHPGDLSGTVVPETGALLAAVSAVADAVPTRVIGKPAPDLFQKGQEGLGGSASATLVIGDNAETDGQGAIDMGLPFLLIGDGQEHDVATPGALLEFTGTPRHSIP